jgi:hypothetical protein
MEIQLTSDNKYDWDRVAAHTGKDSEQLDRDGLVRPHAGL